jgi:hypothetical protein
MYVWRWCESGPMRYEISAHKKELSLPMCAGNWCLCCRAYNQIYHMQKSKPEKCDNDFLDSIFQIKNMWMQKYGRYEILSKKIVFSQFLHNSWGCSSLTVF